MKQINKKILIYLSKQQNELPVKELMIKEKKSN